MSQTPPNDKPMNEDEAWVSEQYQKTMREQGESTGHSMPSASIDEAILAKAKQASIPPNNTEQTSNPKKPSRWLRWQFGGSVAASVVILVFIYIGNHENVLEQATLSNPASPSSFMDVQEEMAAPSPLQTTSSESKPAELLVNEMNSLSSGTEAPIELNLAAQTKAVYTQMQSIKQADEAAARRATAMQSRMKRERQTRLVEKEKASPKEKNEQQDVVTELDVTAQRKASNESDTVVGELKPDTYTDLQIKLFKLLQKQKLAEQDWRLPKQYRAVLTEKQIQTLLNEEEQ